MLSAVFITFYFSIVYYSASLNCGGQRFENEDFVIHPIIIWDLDNGNFEKAKTDSLRREVSELFTSAVRSEFGFRCLLNYDGPPCTEGKVRDSVDERKHLAVHLLQWLKTFRTPDVLRLGDKFMVAAVSFFINPPKVLNPYNIEGASVAGFDAAEPANHGIKDALRLYGASANYVHWPIVITNKGLFEEGPFKGDDGINSLSSLLVAEKRVSVVVLNTTLRDTHDWTWLKYSQRARTKYNIKGYWNVITVPHVTRITQNLSLMSELFADMIAVMCMHRTPLSTLPDDGGANDPLKYRIAGAGVGAILIGGGACAFAYRRFSAKKDDSMTDADDEGSEHNVEDEENKNEELSQS